ncbi:hypothetical protein DH2020_043608 [Rehmannia glutinosa]|uniref:Uncharacterized protein n=1 Tax=Rehmannia glutinosa TaxID=99300 RepID=A0ABR0UL08_REHGL
MPTLMEAFQMSSSNFSDIITNLKPDLLIYDILSPGLQKLLHHKASLVFIFLLLVRRPIRSLIISLHTQESGHFPYYPAISLREGIEGKYMDYLSTLCHRKIVPTGPLITHANYQESGEYSEIMDWLSQKSKFSTLYISFGSENYLSKEQMQEMAGKGLELSGVNFIWVVRSPIGSEISIEETLSEELLDKIKQKRDNCAEMGPTG